MDSIMVGEIKRSKRRNRISIDKTYISKKVFNIIYFLFYYVFFWLNKIKVDLIYNNFIIWLICYYDILINIIKWW
jgi:hypothetical protein